MDLRDDINRIKEVMGILNESSIKLPLTVTGSFKGDNGDRTHAFQSTNNVVVGNMENIVDKKLKEVYNAGYNPDITDLKVTIDLDNKTTNWSVTIDQSTDGNAYMGIVTVGSCCNGSYEERADGQVERMKTWNADPSDHYLIDVLQTTADGSSKGNITIKGGKYKLKQHFYKYTKDNKKPHPPKNPEGKLEKYDAPQDKKTEKKDNTNVSPPIKKDIKIKSIFDK